MSIANTTNTALQNLLDFVKQTKTSNTKFDEFTETNFSQVVNSTNSVETTAFFTSRGQTQGTTNSLAEFSKMASLPFIAGRIYSNGWSFLSMTWQTSTTTSISVSNLLSQESDSALPLKAFLASELNDIDKTQLEALSKDTLKTELEAKEGFKTIFFRDAQSFEFMQDTLSEASIKALKDEFGEESFLEREDGSLVLTGKAEKFVSGWQKALSEANSSEISLDELVKKDTNFDGTLDSSELGELSQNTTITQITQETLVIVELVVIVGYLSTLHDNEIEAFLADFHSLTAGFAFENLSTTSKAWLEEIFPQLFGEKSDESSNQNADDESSSGENSASDESIKQFNKAKFDEFYANFKASFNLISVSFMGLKGYQAQNLNFEKLSLVASNLARNFIENSTAQAINLQQEELTFNLEKKIQMRE